MTDELNTKLLELLGNDLEFIKNSVANDNEHKARLARIKDIAKIIHDEADQNQKDYAATAKNAYDSEQLHLEDKKLALEKKRLEFEIERQKQLNAIEEKRLAIEERKNDLEERKQDRELEAAKLAAEGAKLALIGNFAMAGVKILDIGGQFVQPAINNAYKRKMVNDICRIEMKDSFITPTGRNVVANAVKDDTYKKV